MNRSEFWTPARVHDCPRDGVFLAPVNPREPAPTNGLPHGRPTKPQKLPKISRHSSGNARVTIGGRVHYLGKYGTPEMHRRYAELLESPAAPTITAPDVLFTAADLCARWWQHVEGTGKYLKDEQPTSSRTIIGRILKNFCDHLGGVPVRTFTSGLLVQWRDNLERNRKLTRRGINRQVDAVRMVFKWGRQRNLVPKEVFWDLRDIEKLPASASRKETLRERRGVTLEEVERVAAACRSRHVAAMLRLQALTGARPGEIRLLRPCDIDKNPKGAPEVGWWLYKVRSSKTSHHGGETVYWLGPAAQRILEQFPVHRAAYYFSPRASMEERRKDLRAERETPPTKQMRERDSKPRKPFADFYGPVEYGNAVEVARVRAGVDYFTPHEIRHGFATWAIEVGGIAGAQAALNHRHATTTDKYLHRSERAAFSIAKERQRISG